VSADTTDAELGKLPKSLFNATHPGKVDLDASEMQPYPFCVAFQHAHLSLVGLALQKLFTSVLAIPLFTSSLANVLLNTLLIVVRHVDSVDVLAQNPSFTVFQDVPVLESLKKFLHSDLSMLTCSEQYSNFAWAHDASVRISVPRFSLKIPAFMNLGMLIVE
jgi:hypothetical protein